MIDVEDAKIQIEMARSNYLSRLRDECAIEAMGAMLGSSRVIDLTDELCKAHADFHRGDWIAGHAYAFADAMLRARAKT